MIHLGLNQAEFEAYIETLLDTHRQRVTVDVLDARENFKTSLSFPDSKVVSGEVDVDTTGDVSRSLNLTVIDHGNHLSFDPHSPVQGALFAGHFLHVHHGVFVDRNVGRFPDWLDVPVFYGPLTSYVQQDEQVTLEAMGKESLMLDPYLVVQGYAIEKGMKLHDAIRKVGNRAGESKFDLPDLPVRLNHNRLVMPGMEPWKVLTGGERTKRVNHLKTVHPKKHGHKHEHHVEVFGFSSGSLLDIGKDAERYPFYDARGQLVVRRKAQQPVFTFGDRWQTTVPEITYDIADFVNYVHVKGVKGKGAKQTPVGHAALPASHALSPEALARDDDHPLYIAEFIDSQLKKHSDCRDRAEALLDRKSKEGITASFDCLPMPLLEEGDHIRCATGKYMVSFEVKQWTLPLTSDSDMSIGENKRITPRRKRRHGGRG